MKQAKFLCSLSIVTLCALSSGGCSAIYSSCNHDSDCDLSRGEACIKKDGYAGVCALPLRECKPGEIRSCPENCGTERKETCLENGRWSGCIKDAQLSCPTGFLLVSSKTREVVDSEESPEGRGDYMCMACSVEDIHASQKDESNPLSEQCCGKDGKDPTNALCCLMLPTEQMDACLQKHIKPLILQTSSTRDTFCLYADKDDHDFDVLGHEVQVHVDHESIRSCAKQWMDGESEAKIPFALKSEDQRTIGLVAGDRCTPVVSVMDTRLTLNSDIEMKSDTSELSCEALFLPQTYRLLQEHGQRVECDTINHCNSEEAETMLAIREKMWVPSDVGLVCEPTDEMLAAADECRLYMRGELTADGEGDAKGAPIAVEQNSFDKVLSSRCYSAIAKQYGALNRYCSVTSEISNVGDAQLCMNLFDMLSKEFIVACASYDIYVRELAQENGGGDNGGDDNGEGSGDNGDNGQTTTWAIAQNKENKDGFALREKILNAVLQEYSWVDKDRNRRIQDCLSGSCDVREQLEHGGYMHEICSDGSFLSCGSNPCQTEHAVYLEMPSCRMTVEDEKDGGFARVNSVTLTSPITLSSEPSDECDENDDSCSNNSPCEDDSCNSGNGEGNGAPVARMPALPKGMVVDGFDVVHVVHNDDAYDVVAIVYSAPEDASMTPNGDTPADNNSAVVKLGGITLAFYDSQTEETEIKPFKTIEIKNTLLPARIFKASNWVPMEELEVYLSGEKVELEDVSFRVEDVHIAVRQALNSLMLDVYYLADRPVGSISASSNIDDDKMVGIREVGKNYTKSIREAYVMSINLNSIREQSEDQIVMDTLGAEPLYGVFETEDSTRACDLYQIWSNLSSAGKEELDTACGAGKDKISLLWKDKKDDSCQKKIAELCPDILRDEATRIFMDRNHHSNVSIRRKNEDGYYVQYVRNASQYGLEDIGEVYSFGERGIYTTSQLCSIPTSDSSETEKKDYRLQPLYAGHFMTYDFYPSDEVPWSDFLVFGVQVGPEHESDEDDPTGNENNGNNDPGDEGGSGGPGDGGGSGDGEGSQGPVARAPEAPITEMRAEVVLSKLAKFEYTDCTIESEFLTSAAEDAPENVVWKAEQGKWSLALDEEWMSAYVSEFKFLSFDNMKGTCGIWMGIWPVQIEEQEGQVEGETIMKKGLMAARMGICLDHEGRMTFSPFERDALVIEGLEVDGKTVQSISVEPYRDDVALVHVNFSAEGSVQTHIGRLQFVDGTVKFDSIVQVEGDEESPARVESILYPNDDLFTLFEDGSIKKEKIMCTGE